MSSTNGRELPDLPEFLRRHASNESELVKQMPTPAKVKATEAATAAKVPRKAPPKATAKANGHAKAKLVVAPKAKAAKRAARAFDPAKLDRFGFRLGSLKSQAAAIYATKKGATLAEVKEQLDSSQFNVLTQLEEAGHTIEKTPVKGDGPRKVTRYRVIPK